MHPAMRFPHVTRSIRLRRLCGSSVTVPRTGELCRRKYVATKLNAKKSDATELVVARPIMSPETNAATKLATKPYDDRRRRKSCVNKRILQPRAAQLT
jgi:hypothetical protein